MTTDNCWRRDSQINIANPGKLWITCLSVHSCVWTTNQQHVVPHSPSPPSKGYGKKQRGKEERGEAAKAIFMTVCRSKGNQFPARQQLTSIFILFYMHIEINLLQRLGVLNKILEENFFLFWSPRSLLCWFWRKTRLVVIFFIKTTRTLKY